MERILSRKNRRILDENAELKNMFKLFQASQAVMGCLELECVYRLLTENIAGETGSSRAMGLFLEENRLTVKALKGVAPAVAVKLHDAILENITKFPPQKQPMSRIRFSALDIAGLEDNNDAADIKEACLVFVRCQDQLKGVVSLFNDSGKRLPEFKSRQKNILFLLEQASRAFNNAQSYSLAKDMLFIDELSGLFNYRYLEVALDRELKRAERYASHVSILFLDMDSFKLVNDAHGHLVGSRVLKEMGELLKKSVREVDVVIRYGGDEYTIILVETDCAAAASVAERIRRKVESHVFMADEGYDIRMTCSIGYSCCPDDTMSKRQLLDMADKAMYAGKADGKNCVKRFLAPL